MSIWICVATKSICDWNSWRPSFSPTICWQPFNCPPTTSRRSAKPKTPNGQTLASQKCVWCTRTYRCSTSAIIGWRRCHNSFINWRIWAFWISAATSMLSNYLQTWDCCRDSGRWTPKAVRCTATCKRWSKARNSKRWKSSATWSPFTKTPNPMPAWNWWSWDRRASARPAS